MYSYGLLKPFSSKTIPPFPSIYKEESSSFPHGVVSFQERLSVSMIRKFELIPTGPLAVNEAVERVLKLLAVSNVADTAYDLFLSADWEERLSEDDTNEAIRRIRARL